MVQLPEGVVPLTDALRDEITLQVQVMSAKALRCIGFAVKSDKALNELASYDGNETHIAHKSLMDPSKYVNIESGLTFVGIAGLRDPPRPEVRGAIEAGRCRLTPG